MHNLKINFKAYVIEKVLHNKLIYKYVKQHIWFGWYFQNDKWDPFRLTRSTYLPIRRKMCISFNDARNLLLNAAIDDGVRGNSKKHNGFL